MDAVGGRSLWHGEVAAAMDAPQLPPEGDQGFDLRGDAVGVQETPEGGDGCTEEGGDGGIDGMGGQVPIPEQHMERRLGLQYPGQHEEQAAHLSLEEAGLAVEDQGSGAPGIQGEGAMEEEHQMAQLSPELRGGVTLGPLRSDAAETEEQRLCGAEVWGRANSQRGLDAEVEEWHEGSSEDPCALGHSPSNQGEVHRYGDLCGPRDPHGSSNSTSWLGCLQSHRPGLWP